MNKATDKLFADWEDFSARRFPTGYGGVEISGIELVLLDADAAGCISSYFGRFGNLRRLDSERRNILEGCLRDLEKVLPQLQAKLLSISQN